MSEKLRLYKPYTPYLYLLPAAMILIPFVFVALVQVFIYSVQHYNIFTPARWAGASNYLALIQDRKFWDALQNTVKYFLGVVPLLVIIPLFIAVLINREWKGINFFRAVFYFPVITSMVVVGIAWKWIYAENGILNYILTDFIPVLGEPVNWLAQGSTALGSVMVVTIWKGLGYYMIIYLAGLQSIPAHLYEAAQIDGAGRIRQLLHITVPMLLPSISIVTIMSSMAAMKVFDEIYVMTGGGPYGSSRTLVFEVYYNAFEKIKIGYSSAIAVVLFFILLIFSWLSLRFSENKYEK
ncbi:MAG: sugar ABC transporter permease [Spirochaetales bacterium]|nr:sugar ABC transporter permease [Spirochaetales bacterium]